MTASASSIRFPPERRAVLAMFFINGAIFANWVSRIPTMQDKFELSDGALGFVLVGISIGVISALAFAGGLIARYGSRRVTASAAIGLCLALPLLAIAPHPVALWAALLLLGGVMSTMDVSMNAQGVEVERIYARPMMSSFHAAFSIGGFTGAAIGAGMVYIESSPLTHFTFVAVIFAGLALAAGRSLLATAPQGGQHGSVFQLPRRPLWPLGAIAFCAAIGEGSMAEWSGVYLESVVGVEATIAALGFAVFSLTMTIGRLAGDRVTSRYSPVMLVRTGGLIAAAGLLLAIIVPETATALIGFAAVGLGLSVVIPLAFSAAGSFPNIPPGSGIAGVATIGYAGFLAGPPVIGLLSDAVSLPTALVLVVIMLTTLAFTAGALRVLPTNRAAQHAAGS